MNDNMKDYPALDRTPAGNPVRATGNADLEQRQTLHDPDHIEVTQHGSMTVARDAGPRLPFRGPLQHDAGTTISSTAERMQRQLENDLKVREAIYADGLDPATFDISRGVSSRVGDGDTRSMSELKDDLARLSGESDAIERRAFDKAMGLD